MVVRSAASTAHLRPPSPAVAVFRLLDGAPCDGRQAEANLPNAMYVPEGLPLSGGRVPVDSYGWKFSPVTVTVCVPLGFNWVSDTVTVGCSAWNVTSNGSGGFRSWLPPHPVE